VAGDGEGGRRGVRFNHHRDCERQLIVSAAVGEAYVL